MAWKLALRSKMLHLPEHSHEFHHSMPLGTLRCVCCGARKETLRRVGSKSHLTAGVRDKHRKIVVAYA